MSFELRNILRLGLTGMAAAASIAALAAPAQAAGNTSAVKSGNTLLVTAAAGTLNDITLSRSINGQFYNVSDAVGFNAGAGCQSTGARSVQCSAAGIQEIRISAGDGNDRVRLNTSTFSRVLGGTGDDVLISTHFVSQARLSGNDGNDQIFGSAAGGTLDKLFGQEGNDSLRDGHFQSGGNGDDRLTGSNFNDTLNGNGGFDRLDGRGGSDLCVEGEVKINCEL